MKFLVAVYSHPEYYPPTLNALDCLSRNESIEEISIVFRNVKQTEKTYDIKISLKTSGKFKTIRDSQHASYLWKIISFLKFTFKLVNEIKRIKPNYLIIYDPIPLFSYRIIKPFINKEPKLWYHNHDIIEKDTVTKYSISWFAQRSEQSFFNQIDIFTLPSEDRRSFFPVDQLKWAYFFLPNYPSLRNIPIPTKSIQGKKLKLIYQGNIGEGHGLKELIKYIHTQNNTFKLTLNIIGIADNEYKSSLLNLINEYKLSDKIKIVPALPYHQLREFTKMHDVGIAILQPINTAFKTAATSSNKIYEYISCGLPVILYDSSAYKNILNHRNWAFFTDLSNQSFEQIFHNIINNYQNLSKNAYNDFEKELNFENYFEPILKHIAD